MRRAILAALAGVGILFAASAQETFNAVVNRYSNLTSLEATFEERICEKSSGACEIMRGSFIYAAPNKFRLDVDVPSEQLVVSDGEVTWIYLPTAEQAIKTRPGPEQELFLFVGRLKDYSENYTVKLVPTDTFLEARFSAKPEKKPFLKHFTMFINTASNDIAGVRVEEGDTQMDFLLTDYTYNPGLSEDRFSFKPPEGITVIEDKGTGYQQ